MGYVKEPTGIDFVVGPTQLTIEGQQLIHDVIAEYKITKKIPKPLKASHPRRKLGRYKAVLLRNRRLRKPRVRRKMIEKA
jgi:hypothetical protein